MNHVEAQVDGELKASTMKVIIPCSSDTQIIFNSSLHLRFEVSVESAERDVSMKI